MSTSRILVGIPLGWGGVPAQTFEALLRACAGYGLVTHIARTDLNRNWLCQYALEGQYDTLVMLDVDHKHPVDIVERLCVHPQAVVAALAFQRQPYHEPMAYRKDAEGGFSILGEWSGQLVPVDWTASCAIRIDTWVLKKLTFPWFAYPIKRRYAEGAPPPSTSDMSRECPTEDIGFCEKCRLAGIPVYVDTGTVTPHMATVFADEGLYRAMKAARGGPA